MMRTFLITKFVCSKCGNNLQLRYEKPPNSGKAEEGEPTGASMVEQLVVIEPCECCTRPLVEIRQAVQTLLHS